MTKIDCINLIQIELAGGKITADLFQEFSVPEISRVMGVVLDKICMTDFVTRNAMAREYVFTPIESTSGWIVNIDPLPLSGAYSFAYIKDSQSQFMLRNLAMGNIIDVLRGGETNFNATLKTSSLLSLSSKPNGDIRAAYIPNIYLMEDDDELIMSGSEAFLIKSVIDFIRSSRDNRPQEMINDGRIDAKP